MESSLCTLYAFGLLSTPVDFESLDCERTPRCTQEMPNAHDPSGRSEGQCCDPLGVSPALPACNAWRAEHEFVAASAEITAEESNSMFRSCL